MTFPCVTNFAFILDRSNNKESQAASRAVYTEVLKYPFRILSTSSIKYSKAEKRRKRRAHKAEVFRRVVALPRLRGYRKQYWVIERDVTLGPATLEPFPMNSERIILRGGLE